MYGLVDSGAQVNYIDGKLATSLGLEIKELHEAGSRKVRTVDGTLYESSSFTLIEAEDPLSSVRFTFFTHVLYLNWKHQFLEDPDTG